MRNRRYLRFLTVPLLFALVLLGGCDAALFNPKGYIGEEIRTLLYVSVGLMLIVVLPVLFMSLYFPFKYRASNTKAKYSPNWDFSAKIEAVIWGVPIAIVLVLGAVTWHYTHKLDVYKPIPESVSAKKPIEVQVVALNWKWLFIYPEYGIATINELAFPEKTPVNFKITSDTTMTSFFIPRLGSQVYAMAGMTTSLHLIASEEGKYRGTAANYIGSGHSYMKFTALSKSQADFDAWVADIKSESNPLNYSTYKQMVKQENRTKVADVVYYSTVDSDLFDEKIVGKYLKPYKPEADDHVDAEQSVMRL